MTVAIIDYGSGNLRSVARAFERVSKGKQRVQVTASPRAMQEASHIVLPGVGAFADCMKGLSALPDMLPALEREVVQKKKPFLGICVGMQMLFEKGHEHGTHEGLGWLKGEVISLVASGKSQVASKGTAAHRSLATGHLPLKVPHMGWNDITVTQPHPLMRHIRTGDHAYFVHSYHAVCADESDVLATVAYGQTLAAVVGRGNIMGAQFHPEKSQETGLCLLKNFLEL